MVGIRIPLKRYEEFPNEKKIIKTRIRRYLQVLYLKMMVIVLTFQKGCHKLTVEFKIPLTFSLNMNKVRTFPLCVWLIVKFIIIYMDVKAAYWLLLAYWLTK